MALNFSNQINCQAKADHKHKYRVGTYTYVKHRKDCHVWWGASVDQPIAVSDSA